MGERTVIKAADFGVGPDSTPEQNTKGLRQAMIACGMAETGPAVVELPPGEIWLDELPNGGRSVHLQGAGIKPGWWVRLLRRPPWTELHFKERDDG